MDWPADKVSRRPIAELIPYARNARTHSPEQIAQLAASIREWGWTIPILVDEEGSVIAGHARILAASQLGIDDVPCMVASGWSEAKKRAYILADNKLALNAGWDEAVLALELQDIDALGFDQLLTGFSAAEIGALIPSTKANLGDPDEIPETPDDPVTIPGDVWLLGKHRLMCGDSTNVDDVDLLMAGNRANVCLTDPPYGIDDTKSKKNDYDIYQDTPENLRATIDGFIAIAQSIADVIVITPGNWNVFKYPEPKWLMAWRGTEKVLVRS